MLYERTRTVKTKPQFRNRLKGYRFKAIGEKVYTEEKERKVHGRDEYRKYTIYITYLIATDGTLHLKHNCKPIYTKTKTGL